MTLPSPPWAETALTTPPCADLLLEEESCTDDLDGELDGLWMTISIFITLFLLSVCYSATVTLFKVGGHPTGPSGPLSVPRVPSVSLPLPHCPPLSTHFPSLSTHLPVSHCPLFPHCPLTVPHWPLTVYSCLWGRPTWGPVSAHTVPVPPGEVDLLLSSGAEKDDHP